MDRRKHIKIIDLEPVLNDVNQAQKALFERAVDDNHTFLPKGISLEDIDRGFLNYIKQDFTVVVQGKKVPAELFSLQKFSEHMKTWTETDETKTVQLPFIAIVRKPMAKRGTNFGNINFNIPDENTYTVYRVPNDKNNVKGFDLYQIPQPINVDVEYEVNIFAAHQRIANRMTQKALKEFQSSQKYIDVNGHFMNLQWTSDTDNSQLNDLNKRRYYHFVYTVTLKGYLLDKEDFKIVQAFNNMNIATELSLVKRSRECLVDVIETGECDICYTFKFTRKSPDFGETQIAYDVEFTFDNQSTKNYDIILNGENVEFPFIAMKGDNLKLINNQTNIIKPLNIKICGKAIG